MFIKNKHGKVGHLNTKVGQSDSMEWRRSKILELSSNGYNQREIAQRLQITKSVVNRDVLFLRKQARESLEYHIHDKIPEEYQNCMTGMKRNLKQTLEIAETTSDPRTKLQARAIANDCYKYIMDLTTNGVVITDAIKFVQTNKEKLTMSTKEENKESKEPDYDENKDQLEEEQGEIKQETTNEVF
jgi:DNA-binding transcriptional regulator LsrR (DeoR family)